MAVPLFASSGRYVLGPEVHGFERELAEYLGVAHVVGVANGTDALTIALRALGVEPGDEVVVPSFTFYATAEAAVAAGARPIFCDIDPETFCVTRATVERALTDRTRAIVPVHLFGNVAPVDDLRGLGPPILEDAAQAIGAKLGDRRAGALGDAATFSFFPSKNLPALGDAGAIATDDDEVAARARRLRFHGSEDKQTFVDAGYNSRLDELQAAALRVLLPELDGWNAARRAAAAAYADAGLDAIVTTPTAPAGVEPVHHMYVARHERADELVAALTASGIGARGNYRVPIHLQPAMAAYGGNALDLPGTATAARTNLALPMGTDLSEAQVDEVLEAARGAVRALD
jgi:dTDP-4-amino-4,6-dideoxygalactose transaminase